MALGLSAWAVDPPGKMEGMKSFIPLPVFWAANATVNGKLYVLAGSYNTDDGQQQTDRVQIYDPATDSWTEGAPKPTPIYLPAAAAVDGKIYVMGGRTPGDGGGPTNKNECYDPATNTWTTKKNIPVAVRGHVCTGIGTKVYLWGGNTSAYQKTVRIYDTVADTWSVAPFQLPDFFAYGNAVFNPVKNQVYLVGGVKSSNVSAGNFNTGAWIFDVATNAFLATKPAMPVPVREHGIAVSPTGKYVYIFGGSYWDATVPGETEFYYNQVLDCDTNVWQPLETTDMAPFPSPQDRAGYPMPGLIDGKVYIVGGQPAGDTVAIVEEFDPATWMFWEPNPKSTAIRQSPSVQSVGGIVYSIGGWYNGAPNGEVITFNPATGVWGNTNAVDPMPRVGAVSGVWNNKIVISGGDDATAAPVINGYTNIYDPAADTFTALAPDPVTRGNAFGAVVGDTLYVFGGVDATGATVLDSVSALNLSTGTWSAKANLPTVLMGAFASAHGTKIYIVGGFNGAAKPDNGLNKNIVIYDTVANSFSTGSASPYSTYYSAGGTWDKYIINDGGYHRYYSSGDDTVYAEMSQDLLLYDTTTDTWLDKPRAWGRAYHGGAVVGGNYYSLMGADWNFLADRLDIFTMGAAEPCVISSCTASADPTTGHFPLTVAFTSTVSTTGPCTPAYAWAFGDGATAATQDASHTYAAAGTYDWTCTITAQDNQTCTKTGAITVTAPPECTVTCNATIATTGTTGVDVIFFGTATTEFCTGQPTYSWNYGDGNTGVGNNTTHAYAAEGTYTWTLTVTVDGKVCTKDGSITITTPVECTVTCNATIATSGTVGVDVIFFGTATTEFCTGQPSYGWNYGDGNTGVGNNTTHAYATEGTYTWTLTVTVDDKTCTKTGSITVTGVPVCTLTCAATVAASGTVGIDVIFLVSATPSGPCETLTYAWTYGDGATGVGTNTTHAYAAAGTYNWSVTVTAGNVTCTKNGSITITAPGNDPSLTIGDATGSVGEQVTLPITLTTNGAQICGTSNKVNVQDINFMTFVEATLGPAGTAAGKQIFSSQNPTTKEITIGVSGFNTTPIADGIVAYVKFTINSGASGSTTVSSVCGSSDCAGTDLTTACSSGTVTVRTHGLMVDLNWDAPIGEGCNPATNLRAEVIRPKADLVNPELAIGEATAREGESVTLPITLSINGAQICGTSNKITYDFARLDYVEATLGPAGTAAGKQIFVSQNPTTKVITLGVSGFNTTPIADGIVAYVKFTIKAGATGDIAIQNVAGASDCAGTDLNTTSVDGVVHVFTPPVLQGYDVYRGLSQSGDFTKINPAVIPVGTTHFLDNSPSLGVLYYRVKALYNNCTADDSNTVEILVAECSVTCTASADPASGEAPLTVNFTSSVTQTPDNCAGAVSYFWAFGDSTNSIEQNPSHTYLAAGDYTWTFTATAGNTTCTKTGMVTVTCSLTCDANVPTSGLVGVSSVFFGTATTNCSGNPQYAWDYGDGNTGVGNNTTHAYAAAGTYTWTLTVTVDGKTCTKTGSITVLDCSFTCTASATPTAGDRPLTVLFVATTTQAPDNCAGTESYAWTFGDGATATTKTASHTYTTAGTHTWTFTVTAGNFTCSKTGEVTVTIPPCAITVCTATATPASGTIPLLVNYSGNVVTSGECGTPTYAWNFGDGTAASTKDASHTYNNEGNYNWTFTVTVDGLTCSKSGTVQALCDPPTVTLVTKVPNPFRLKIDTVGLKSGYKVYVAGQSTAWTNIKVKTASQFIIKGAGSLFPKNGNWVDVKIENPNGCATTIQYNRSLKQWRVKP
jgi:PKD repeat protein